MLVLAGGIVHFKLWNDGYRHIDKIGPSFLLNAIGSAAAAVALVVWRHWLAPLGAPGRRQRRRWSAFGLSRTERGILDFTERGWNPSPEAAMALAFEIGAAAVLLVSLLLEAGVDRRRRRPRPASARSPRPARRAPGARGPAGRWTGPVAADGLGGPGPSGAEDDHLDLGHLADRVGRALPGVAAVAEAAVGLLVGPPRRHLVDEHAAEVERAGTP